MSHYPLMAWRRRWVAPSRLLFPGLVALLTALCATPALAGDSRWFIEGRSASASLDSVFRTNHSQIFDEDDLVLSLELGYEPRRRVARPRRCLALLTFLAV